MSPQLTKASEASFAPKRYKILNTYVNALSMAETIESVEEIVSKRIPTQHVVINASKVNLIESDPELAKIVNSCPLINADGASIVWAAKELGIPLTERVAGIDLFFGTSVLIRKEGLLNLFVWCQRRSSYQS